MKSSAIELTEEQKKKHDQKRVEAFVADFKKVEVKHQLTFASVLDVSPLGVKPVIRVVNLPKES